LCSEASQSAHKLVNGDRLARHELVSGRRLPDLRQCITRLLLGGVSAANLLTLPGERIHPSVNPKSVAHNSFPGLSVERRQPFDLRR
jgi:hypothetical protein